VKGSTIHRILESPVAFSPLVILLQIPWALGLAFSTVSSGLTNPRLTLAGLAIVHESVIGLSLALGAWGVRRFLVLQTHRAIYTLVLWIFAAWLTVAANEAYLHIYSITTEFDLRFKLINASIVWLVGLASATYVIQSRRNNLDAFQDLQKSNEQLSRLEDTWWDALQSERQSLVESIDQTITPALRLLSFDLRVMQNESLEQPSAQARLQIDDQVLPKLRQHISQLSSNTPRTMLEPESLYTPTKPRLVVSQLPVAATRSLIVGIAMGLPLFISMVGMSKVTLWLLQITAIYSPVFILERIAQRMTKLLRLPNAFWVLLACVTVVTLRLTIFAEPTFVTVATKTHTPPVIVGIVYTLSIMLASLDKYFVDAYITATTAQQVTKDLLNSRLASLETTRQSTRNDLARVLHGSIQGRLASVRLKLNMLDESAGIQGGTSIKDNIGEIADILDEITHELETLGEPRTLETELTTIDQIALLQRNWMGFITVSYNCSPQAATMLASDSSLDRKVATTCMEVTTNASRHGDASELVIRVELVNDESILRLIAQDNGCGTTGPVTAGMGLSEIDANGGSWSFEPWTTGARLRVDLPVNLLRE
jgi:signal transduction histidine kinase